MTKHETLFKTKPAHEIDVLCLDVLLPDVQQKPSEISLIYPALNTPLKKCPVLNGIDKNANRAAVHEHCQYRQQRNPTVFGEAFTAPFDKIEGPAR